ncbi:helix-turn-helix domain-containing protein [Burkholderia vietnamiensis]|uniref:helix-turn-helix domain-containing protein n=1 Tax=Burkholderia vietnamiensis TaxID=60552 RepID=UPI0009BCD954|nr:helix-turn-helix domain-containing protein [Burkholderia vietnamiensis]
MSAVPSSGASVCRADTVWVHLFKAMIQSGEVARMGAHAFTVYSVIKAHVDLKTGWAFPGINTIVEESGVSKSKVIRSLETLEGMGYLERRRRGRQNEYRLREKVPIRDDKGQSTAIATWDYVPTRTQAATENLRQLLVGDGGKGAQIVQIMHLQVNVTQTTGDVVIVNSIGTGATAALDFLRAKFPMRS